MSIEAVGRNLQVNGLEINNRLEAKDLQKVEEQVSQLNKSLNIAGRQVKQQLDKNDFLTLLVAQLKNQDPTNPIEDKQFIAQMAQFTTLEQMNNMSEGFKKLSGLLSSGQAAAVLGRQVDVQVHGQVVSGAVSEVTSGDFPQVLVNGNYYNFSDITRIRQK